MRSLTRLVSRSTVALVLGASVLVSGLGAAPSQAAVCLAGEVCTVTLDGVFLRELSTTGTFYTAPDGPGTGEGYTISVTRDAAAHAYTVDVVPVGPATLTDSQTFGITLVVNSSDAPTVLGGRADIVDYSILDAPTVYLSASPVRVSECVSGSLDSCDVATRTVLSAVVHYGDGLADISASSWSAPVAVGDIRAQCPATNRTSSALGVALSLSGPASQQDYSPNSVATSLRIPLRAASSCWGRDVDQLAAGLVVLHDGAVVDRVTTPAGSREYGLGDPLDCGGVCIGLDGITFPGGSTQAFTIAYAYKSLTAKGYATSYLARKSVKRSGLSKRNTRHWAITLKGDGSSPACIQNGAAVSALRVSSQGANVVCKYTITFQRKVGKKWKTQRVGGAFTAR